MKKLGESKEKWHKAGYEDGYRKGVEDAAKVAENTKMEQMWEVDTARIWLAGKNKIAAKIRALMGGG